MKKLFLIVISLLFCLTINASGPIITDKVDSVIVNAPVRLFIYQGDTTAIRLRGEEKIKQSVICNVKDGVLTVKTNSSSLEEVQGKGLILYLMTPKGSNIDITTGRGYTIVRLGGNHDKK